MRKASKGFTLVEVMVVLAILAILLGIGMPGYRTLIAQQRVKTTATDLHSALALARSEAIKRNRMVTLSPSVDGWSAGWAIASPEAGQPALLNHIQVSGVVIVGPADVAFSASGRRPSGAVDVVFVVSSADDGDKVSCVTLAIDGRAKSGKEECAP
jgi:type IV fimbrial biogenesis protein FimT